MVSALVRMLRVKGHRPTARYSPHLNVVERLWKLLRQRHPQLALRRRGQFLQSTLRKHLDWLQIHRSHVRSVISADL